MIIIVEIINSSKVGVRKYLQHDQKHHKDSVIDSAKMQGISKQTITIITSKFSRPKNKLVLADIYAIKQKGKVKQKYIQKLINVRTHNVKRFLGNLTQNMPWFYISAFNILPLKVPIKVLIKVPKKVPIKVIETSSNNRTCPEVLK